MTKRSTFAILAALALLLAACGGGAAEATPTSAVVLSGETATAATAEAGGGVPSSGLTLPGTGLCAHLYYPVVVGAVHSYSSTGSGVEPFTFTDTITEVREDGFTLSSDFNGLIREQEWLCSAEGLVTLQLTGGAAASIQTSGMNGEFTTSNVTGVTLPADVAPGDSWAQSFDTSGSIEMATGDTATSIGNASYTFTAVGVEDVTTNSGVFSALRVESVGTITMEVSYEGITLPLELTTNSVSWYAPGVGWVRLEENSSINGTSFSYTVDLESYSIP
jgi:hypothetical protein